MDIQAYLQRIQFPGTPKPNYQTLVDLQRSHLLTVPFENLSIHWGEPIFLQEQALFNKIVQRKRGGFCYELNGLFSALLRELEFSVTRLSAGVYDPSHGMGPEFDHMTIMVELDRRYLLDVGFGDSFRQPLLLDERGDQMQGSRAYRIERDGEHYILLEKRPEDEWNLRYRFILQPRCLDDYQEMCIYHQTSPDSAFTQNRVCSKATPDGRITLSDMRIIETKNGVRNERKLANDEEFLQLLDLHFGFTM